MSNRRIGILGGTFDPIHNGHLEAAAVAKAALDLSSIYVVPAGVPWQRHEPQASGFHRFAMVSLAVAGRDGWRADDLELLDNSESYTSDTLQKFHRRGCSPADLFFIVGGDAFAGIDTWRNYPALLEYANFAVVSRPGCSVAEMSRRLPALSGRMVTPPLDGVRESGVSIVLIDAPTPDVSATNIRERCAHRESIAGLVPDPVRIHIEQHGLYTSPAPRRRAGDAAFSAAAGRSHGQD
jgi:nicotinate-nucleotide adenylyltransferase